MNTPGYEQLAQVLQAAYDQASKGKGAERHADDKPFHEQPMQTGSDLLGTDAGLAFQAIKKIREGSTFPEFDRFERELLGAINYVAGMIIWRRKQLPPAGYKHPTCPGCGLYREHSPTCPVIADRMMNQVQPYVAPDPCAECGYLGTYGDEPGTHYATCSKLTAPEGFVAEVEATFDELEADPADERMDNIARNGNDGEHYDDPWVGAPAWAKYKAQDEHGIWWWYSDKPAAQANCNFWLRGDHFDHAEPAEKGDRNPNWRDTLIERP